MASVRDGSKAPGQGGWANAPPLAKRRFSRTNKSGSPLNALNTLDTSSLGIDTSVHLQPSPSDSYPNTPSPQAFFDARTGHESRLKLREHLFGERDNTSPSPVEVLEGDGLERQPSSQPTGGFKSKMARTSTMISKHASIRLPGLSKPPSRLSIMDGPDDADNILREIKAKAISDSNNAFNHGMQTNGERTVAAPIRRKSLFTPGLATRNPENPLRKLSAYIQDERGVQCDEHVEFAYYYNPGLSDASPLATLAALDLADSRRDTPVQRVATPADRDYGLLGIGLRITNGMASPNPSNRSTIIGSRTSTPRPIHMESFYTAVEGSVNGDDLRPPPELMIAKRQTSSPLRAAVSVDSFATCFAENHAQGTSGNAFAHKLLDKSSVLALEYMAAIPDSPFTSVADLNKPLPFAPTTKANEFEDELFEDRASTPTPSERSLGLWPRHHDDEAVVVERSGFFEGDSISTLKRSGGEASASRRYSREQAPAAPRTQSDRSIRTEWPATGNGQQHMGTLVTSPVESYGSAVKLEQELDYKQLMFHQQRPDISPADSGYCSVASSQDEHQQLSYQKLTGASRPNIESYRTQSDFSALSYGSAQSRIDVSRHGRSATREAQRASRSSRRKSPAPQPSSEKVTTVSPAREPESTMDVNRKKLQKKTRPKSMPPPLDRNVFPRDREISGTHIPPVPLDIAERHAMRSREFPPLHSTVPNLGHSRSNADMGRPIPLSVPLKFPSPAPPKAERRTSRRIFSGRLSFAPEPIDEDYTGVVQSAPIRPSRSERRNSRHGPVAAQEDSQPVLTDFGEVAQYLGGSPYDAATASRNPAHAPSRDARMHPHHMTNALPKSRSMIGMSEAQASEVNRMRALHRASTYQERSRAPLASPELVSPPLSAPVDVYLPGRLDEHDHYWREQQQQERRGAPPQPPADQGKPGWAPHGAAWAQRRQQADEAQQQQSWRPRPGRMSLPVDGGGRVAQMTGRFEGGFAYGYEPGMGLNGSAGTRDMRSGASRKSVQMGQRYGIDLTDVPVFVTPSIST